MLSLFILCISIFPLFHGAHNQHQQTPNIIFLVFDDLGWMDVSYNGGQLPTHNIDSLFKESISLQRHYIHLICSVSRSQLLTGRYSMYSGYGKMSPFGVGHIGGIPNGLPTLPQWLKAYKPDITTYGVGKWHLGYATQSLLPHSKGFDHFFGFWQGAIKYDTGKIIANKCDGCNGDRYDLHVDGQDYDAINEFDNTMYLYRDKILEYIDIESETDTSFYMYLPLQSPHGPLDYVKNYKPKCMSIISETVPDALSHRLKYCETMLLTDDIVGDIINKLKDTSQWENTLFILTTDNGGDIENTGCNYPFRGTKGTLFEGNQRVIALIGGGVIPKEQHETQRYSLFSSLDWTPTLLQFTNILDDIANSDRTWDGVNQYNLLMYGDEYTNRYDRDHIVFNIGLRNLDSATVVFKYPDDGKLYKYIAQSKTIEKAQYMREDGWCIPEPETGNWHILANDPENPDVGAASQPLDDKMLFDLIEDVSEKTNLLIENKAGTYDVTGLKKYALSLFQPYMKHELFSENIDGLWEYKSEEDKTSNGEIFIHPWMSQEEYLETVNKYIDIEINDRHNPISDELRELYTKTWVSPLLNVKSNDDDEVPSLVNVPSSCIGLSDGEYILKLLDDEEFPLVNVECSNEYMIIDIKKDANWKKYFTSWSEWHYDISGPNKNDGVNYNEWFIPAPYSPYVDTSVADLNTKYADIELYRSGNKPTKYLISPQCNKCDLNDTYHNQYFDKTVYNMNPAAYGLFFGVRRPACDFEWDTLQCKTCRWNTNGFMSGYPRSYDLTLESTAQPNRNLPNIMIGVCLTEVRSAFQAATKDFEQFTGYGPWNYKPTIGINGRFCQCVQIQQPPAQYIAVSAKEYHLKLKEIEENKQVKKNLNGHINNNIYYLSQSDFEIGTYRIVESGTYILSENILLNFNSPTSDGSLIEDIESPNDPTTDWWWPPNTSEMRNKYPGAGYKAREQFMLGYFAGITIETHDVTLDLNGYTIEMSREYYYQQPFFAIIELMSQPFLPNQGPGFFGANPQFAENVIIKNGIIGRTSHHGIHGTKNKNIRIEDIKIRGFMTHGIQMNGYDGLHLENIEIGPTTSDAYLNHNYAHLRIMLPYLYKLANYDADYMDKTISFDSTKRRDNGKEYTLNDLIDIAVPKLDKVFKYIMSDKFNIKHLNELIKQDEDFKLFINSDGLPYGAVVYGIYLNYPGSGIFGWDVSDQRSDNLYIRNIQIHDLYHSGKEVFGLSKNKKRFIVNTLLAPLNLEHLFGNKDIIKEWIYNSYNREDGAITIPHYVGNIATDIYLAQYKFGSDRFDEFWFGAPYVGGLNGRLIQWAEGTDPDVLSSATYGGDYFEPVCAIDGMVHPGKGLIGLKITNADHAIIDSGTIKIYNLFDSTPLGEDDICISKSNFNNDIPKVIGSEQTPYQVAFSMNQIFGISIELSNVNVNDNVNIYVNNIKSNTGRVLGIVSWYSSKINFKTHSYIQINDIFAGISVEKNKFSYTSIPNHQPEACAFAIWNGKYVTPETNYIDYMDEYYNTQFNQFCINGHIGCFGDATDYTNINGPISESNPCELSENKQLQNQIYLVKEKKQEEQKEKQQYFFQFDNNYYNYSVVVVVVFAVIIFIKQCSSYKNDKYFQYISIH